jgi:hypothetical protein
MKPQLFDLAPRPRAPRRILAHAVDAGELDVHVPRKTCIANFICSRCGWDEWVPATGTEARRGIPCPVCDPEAGREWAAKSGGKVREAGELRRTEEGAR